MWDTLWNGILYLFSWFWKEKNYQRSDFESVTGGYQKLTDVLQARIAGLIEEQERMKHREEALRKEHDEFENKQNVAMEKVKKQLRACRTRETVNLLHMERMEKDIKEHTQRVKEQQCKIEIQEQKIQQQEGKIEQQDAQIKSLEARMDKHDSGEMKGLSQ